MRASRVRARERAAKRVRALCRAHSRPFLTGGAADSEPSSRTSRTARRRRLQTPGAAGPESSVSTSVFRHLSFDGCREPPSGALWAPDAVPRLPSTGCETHAWAQAPPAFANRRPLCRARSRLQRTGAVPRPRHNIIIIIIIIIMMMMMMTMISTLHRRALRIAAPLSAPAPRYIIMIIMMMMMMTTISTLHRRALRSP